MSSPTAFFEERQPAAVLKHGILRRYLQPFASKTGATSPGHRVVYVDGYAGPGVYSDGTPGSPALAVQTAEVISTTRNLECLYIEQDENEYHQLRSMLAPYRNWEAFNDPLEECLPEVMIRVGRAPVFTFLDPFGLPIPFDSIVHNVLRRPMSRKTELLLNFSTPGLNRNAGHLQSQKNYPAKKTFIARLDQRLGGDWWRDIWRDHQPPDRNDLIRQKYVERLAEAGTGGWGWWTFPVSRRPQGPPIYHLIFLSRHRDGLWIFNQALSLALKEYHEYCARVEPGEQMTLDLDSWDEREQDWITGIESNIEELLRSGSFVVEERLDEVCGEALGYARETHIRKAIKSLYAQGVTATDGKGDIQRMRVVPA